MAKPQKAKKATEKDGEGRPVRRRHKKGSTARHRQESKPLRDDDPAVICDKAKKKLAWCENKLKAKLEILPTKSMTVLRWNLDRIGIVEKPRIPGDMPACDAADILNDIEWYRKVWQEFETAAAKLSATYGTRNV